MNKFPKIYKFLNFFSRMSLRICFLKNRFPQIYKFHNFHLQNIKKKIVIGRTFYYTIYVLMYYCDCLFGLTKRQKEAASAFWKIETHFLSQEKLNSRRV